VLFFFSPTHNIKVPFISPLLFTFFFLSSSSFFFFLLLLPPPSSSSSSSTGRWADKILRYFRLSAAK
jgi:hypothetical protein